MKIHGQGAREWNVHWRGTAGLLTPEQANVILRELEHDGTSRASLRNLLGEKHNVQVLDDTKLVELLSKLLASGQLVVTWKAGIPPPPLLKSGEAPQPTVATPMPAPDRTEDEEPEGFPPNHDMVAQAEALIASAEVGTPFCEECAKAAAEDITTVVPPITAKPEEPTLAADLDEKSQIATLEKAAEIGAPFCEECARAAAAAAEAKAREAQTAKKTEPSVPAEAPDEAKFSPETHNVDAQVQALQTAAESGTPFCEECAKAAAKAMAPAGEEAKDSPPATAGPAMSAKTHDMQAQANALQAAAKSGVPFCEECAKLAAETATAPAGEEAKDTPPEAAGPAMSDKTHDMQAQADTLQAAAQSGTPFCEECAKAAAAEEKET